MADGTKSRKLDQIDAKILTILQSDGRITNQRLSELVGLSPRPCLERVNRLERESYIRRYMAIVDFKAVSGQTTFFAEITLRDQTQAAQAAFDKVLRACPEVIDCYLVSGQIDYVARIVCPSLDRYRELTASWIDDPRLPVARISTSIVLSPVREFGGYPVTAADEG
ncbi:Lrp/AsnC family transcriptional regulator [Anaeromyxobacter terrae]|uniref:Lrp/AsnC family transcriptional regulator n=1 Tax=Anaeromyxobacter terrae TaxID=2925406 RepID=UPI001F59DC42|nr:Lrp/AsnC family transcriptional regulator [Anaeromyxobacter sp. SG22]